MFPEFSAPTLTDVAEFIRLINDAHKESGRNLREVAELCAIDHSYLWLILQGRRRPRWKVLLSLCTFGWGLDPYETEAILRAGHYQTIMNWQKAGWD